MVKKKGQSKRSTLKDKYRVQRRVAETHRKRRKQDKKDIASGKKVTQKTKDPGIPNSWPFKQDLLKDIARARERTQEQVTAKKQQRQQELLQLHEHQAGGGTARTITELMEQVQSDNSNYTQKQLAEEEKVETDAVGSKNNKKRSKGDVNSSSSNNNSHDSGQQSRRAYLRELKKVIDQSDVILQVLDARDPISTRMNRQQEDSILSHVHKRMVLVLNKIDLVPKHVVSEWLSYLRKSHPTIAIKASSGGVVNNTAASGNKKKNTDDDTDTAISSTPLGMDGLLQLLKNYARTTGVGSNKKQNKSTIVVGIVGYPNTGKSSIINALKRTRAVGVSARPGFTTCLQEVVLDTNVRLIDSPGVVFDDTSTMLANCVDTESMDDPITPIVSLLQRANHNSLLLTYNIPTFTPPTNVDLFLGLVAKSYGRVLKGGIPDKKAAARAVLRDWNSGKIPYFTIPPKSETASTANSNSTDAIIVNAFGPEFDISKYDKEVLDTATNTIDEMDCIQLDSEITQQQVDMLDDMDDDDEEEEDEMDEEEEEEDDEDDDDDEDDYDFNSMIK
jgi:nuclear GTP-binding protein